MRRVDGALAGVVVCVLIGGAAAQDVDERDKALKSLSKKGAFLSITGPKVAVVLQNRKFTNQSLAGMKSDLIKLHKTSPLHLTIAESSITDSGLTILKDLPDLHGLNARDSKITDAGLVHLKGLSKLRFLSLVKTKVSDAGLVHLEGLKSLDTLEIFGTRVTAKGLQRLKSALPGTEIVK